MDLLSVRNSEPDNESYHLLNMKGLAEKVKKIDISIFDRRSLLKRVKHRSCHKRAEPESEENRKKRYRKDCKEYRERNREYATFQKLFFKITAIERRFKQFIEEMSVETVEVNIRSMIKECEDICSKYTNIDAPHKIHCEIPHVDDFLACFQEKGQAAMLVDHHTEPSNFYAQNLLKLREQYHKLTSQKDNMNSSKEKTRYASSKLELNRRIVREQLKSDCWVCWQSINTMMVQGEQLQEYINERKKYIWNKIVAIHHLLFITFSQHAADADKEKMKRIVVYFAPDSQIPRLLSAAWISLLKSADFPWTEDIPEIELDCEDTSLSFSFLTNRKTTIASEMDASIDRPQSVDMLTTCSPEFKEKLQVEDVKALTTHATPTALPSPYITLTRQTVPASTLDQKGTNDTFNSSNRKRAGFSIDELLRPDSTIPTQSTPSTIPAFISTTPLASTVPPTMSFPSIPHIATLGNVAPINSLTSSLRAIDHQREIPASTLKRRSVSDRMNGLPCKRRNLPNSVPMSSHVNGSTMEAKPLLFPGWNLHPAMAPSFPTQSTPSTIPSFIPTIPSTTLVPRIMSFPNIHGTISPGNNAPINSRVSSLRAMEQQRTVSASTLKQEAVFEMVNGLSYQRGNLTSNGPIPTQFRGSNMEAKQSRFPVWNQHPAMPLSLPTQSTPPTIPAFIPTIPSTSSMPGIISFPNTRHTIAPGDVAPANSLTLFLRAIEQQRTVPASTLKREACFDRVDGLSYKRGNFTINGPLPTQLRGSNMEAKQSRFPVWNQHPTMPLSFTPQPVPSMIPPVITPNPSMISRSTMPLIMSYPNILPTAAPGAIAQINSPTPSTLGHIENHQLMAAFLNNVSQACQKY